MRDPHVYHSEPSGGCNMGPYKGHIRLNWNMDEALNPK